MEDSGEIGERLGVQKVFTGVGGDFLNHQSLAITETLTVTLIMAASVLSSHTPGCPGHQPFLTMEETEAGNQSFWNGVARLWLTLCGLLKVARSTLKAPVWVCYCVRVRPRAMRLSASLPVHLHLRCLEKPQWMGHSSGGIAGGLPSQSQHRAGSEVPSLAGWPQALGLKHSPAGWT